MARISRWRLGPRRDCDSAKRDCSSVGEPLNAGPDTSVTAFLRVFDLSFTRSVRTDLGVEWFTGLSFHQHEPLAKPGGASPGTGSDHGQYQTTFTTGPSPTHPTLPWPGNLPHSAHRKQVDSATSVVLVDNLQRMVYTPAIVINSEGWAAQLREASQS